MNINVKKLPKEVTTSYLHDKTYRLYRSMDGRIKGMERQIRMNNEM